MFAEADLDYSVVPTGHINPVLDYHVVSPRYGCFVCKTPINEVRAPYPGFGVNFRSNQDDRNWALSFFDAAGSISSPQNYDVPKEYGIFVCACPTHAENLQRLRELIKDPDRYTHTGRLSIRAIQESLGPKP